MSPFVLFLLELALIIGAGAGVAFGWGHIDTAMPEPARRRMRWVGGFCGVWAVVLGLGGTGHDGWLLRAFIVMTFLGALGFSAMKGPSSWDIVRTAGVGGNLVLLFNGFIFTAVFAGILHSVGFDIEFRSWEMFALIPVGIFAALRVHGLRMMANTPPV